MADDTTRCRVRQTPFLMVPVWVYDHEDLGDTDARVYLALRALVFANQEWEGSKAELVRRVMGRSGLKRSAAYDSINRLFAAKAIRWVEERVLVIPLDPPESSAVADKPSVVTDESSAVADTHLYIQKEEPSSVPHGTNETRQAQGLLDDWWERQDPKPQQPYPAILKVLTKALKGGWSEDDLRRALDEVPVVSGASLDLWRGKQRQRRPSVTYDSPTPAGVHTGGSKWC